MTAPPDLCPLCGADLTGEEIPEKWLEHYGTTTHFSRKIGLYDRDRDCTVAYLCPDCNGTWPVEGRDD